jgi:hypothetical protein
MYCDLLSDRGQPHINLGIDHQPLIDNVLNNIDKKLEITNG